MDISNKTLAMFLVAAIVVSIAGTMISLDKLGQVGYGTPTGWATQDTGTVTIEVASDLSIVISGDSDINFGSCTPQTGGSLLQHNGSGATTTACGAVSDNITLINDGNEIALVTLNVSAFGEVHGGTGGTAFLESVAGDSWIAYRVDNASTNPGCIGSLSNVSKLVYQNITNVNAGGNGWPICTKLNTPSNENAIEFGVGVFLPETAITNANEQSNMIFWAEIAP